MYKKILAITLAALLFLAGVNPAFAQDGNDNPPDGTIALTIVHTNDTHGQYKNSASTVGFEKVKAIADKENADLILDAGDAFHGLPFATIEQGKSTAELLRAVGYDAVCPGNHDFNYGAAALKALGTEEPAVKTEDSEGKADKAQKNFKLLNVNVVNASDGQNYFQPYITKTVTRGEEVSVKVGVFGLISPDIYSSTAPENVKDVRFDDAVEAAKKTVSKLKNDEKCDVIIALTHIGMTEKEGMLSSRDIAKAVPEINVIIDGHTHAQYSEVVGNTLIAQTGAYFSNAGIVKIFYEPDSRKIVNTVGHVISSADAEAYESNWEVSKTIEDIEARQKPVLNQVVGKTDVPLEGSAIKTYTEETNLGRVITSAYLETTGADIAFENCGGIRASIAAGDITKGSVIGVSPFGNYLVTKKITGADLKSILEKSLEMGANNLKAYQEGKHEWPANGGGSYLQIGGMKVAYDPARSLDNRLVSVDIGGAPLDLDSTYTVVTNQFVASNASKYPELAVKPELNQYGVSEEAVMRYITNHSGKEEWAALMSEKNLKAAGGIEDTGTQPGNEAVENQNPMTDPSEEEQKQTSGTQNITGTGENAPTGVFDNKAGAAIFAAAALAVLILGAAVFKHESDYHQQKEK
ncbi:2',3'-cyclic-nucleotide 2'-phosphodiesterase/5'-or 3'-nucleotidase, 5'-nucleotidase family [Eubacterium maltosivorans]|uniref:bifunctional metallophosphatase/5'-nucleotidase n=1 Tax=Eubacterium maltosivorans TaxID=2041044 RepID=UPI00087E5FDE|nr:5'-nucleotidase C-terminal domain-containing protein [Eubacterium maltosivorans]WPK81060.1 Trifunctional nucleotide phosphoesterase protein YfkN [Eubacterium maltosivorans]SDO72525.1 2',3'-cyclic-nucleotide 2'-phosphodiesterase/5'-or 3'-nucleotidase, 5'-nucleotidase family [Eubacterium maltosivorans]